jgi:hypothetical protein
LRGKTRSSDSGDFRIIKILDAVLQPVFVGISISINKRDYLSLRSVHAYVSLLGRFDGSGR